MVQQIETAVLLAHSGAGKAAAPPLQASCRRLDSRELFALGNELTIDHEGTSYRLRITRQGKLILTK